MVNRSKEEVVTRPNRLGARELAAGAIAVGLAVVGSVALRLHSRGKQTPHHPSDGWVEIDLTTNLDQDS